MNTPLSTFPTPLLRLILCGGKGLAPAWGPVLQAGSQVLGCGDPNYGQWAWDAVLGAAVRPDRAPKCLLDKPDGWSIPLDATSPWPARLAMVAAWMASAWMPAGVSAEVCHGERWICLYTYSERASDVRSWACGDGANIEPGAVLVDLPTLPQHLQTHPPAVALLLALYDVPEIRARVESA